MPKRALIALFLFAVACSRETAVGPEEERSSEEQGLETRMYTVGPHLFADLIEETPSLVDESGIIPHFEAEDVLTHYGVTFPEGAIWYRGMATAQAKMKNTPENHERFTELITKRGLGHPGFEFQE